MIIIINIMFRFLRLEMVAAPRQRAHRDSQSQRSDDGRRRDGSLRAIIIIITIIIIIKITRPKPASGRQGLAGVSLRTSGAQLGQIGSDDFS